MDEKFKQFQAYDWVNCPEWRIYYDNLYPIPPGNKVIYYKKKFCFPNRILIKQH